MTGKRATNKAQEIYIEYMPLSDLITRLHPKNPKDHAVSTISGSLEAFGYKNSIGIDENTGYIAFGHGRIKTLTQRKRLRLTAPEGIKVEGDEWFVPVQRGMRWNSEAELLAYMIADNRTQQLGGWDDNALARALQDVEAHSPNLMTASGYDQDDLDALIHRLETPGLNLEDASDAPSPDPYQEWKGMPEFEQPDKPPFKTVMVHFENEDDLMRFAKLVEQKLTLKTKSIWYPAHERQDATKLVWSDKS